MNDQRVERVSDDDIDAAFGVRHRVFVEGQGVPVERELDGHDDEATHFLAFDGDTVVGTARLREYDGPEDDTRTAKVERVAVLEPRRGEGWGTRLMAAVEDHAREASYDRVLLHAQVPVVDFYEHLGYEARGEEFADAGIPHREMTKPL
jgi:predicted GNAT family N-acyltransferase